MHTSLPQKMVFIMMVGCMFASKTTQLITKLRKYERAGKKVVALKPALDTRGENVKLCTHDGVTFEAVPVERLDFADFSDFDVVGLDELQFFGEDVVPFCVAMLKAGKTVIGSGLSGSFNQTSMGHMDKLYPLATSITHLTAVCTRCGEDASYTKKFGGSGEVVEIGAGEL